MFCPHTHTHATTATHMEIHTHEQTHKQGHIWVASTFLGEENYQKHNKVVQERRKKQMNEREKGRQKMQKSAVEKRGDLA